MAKLKHVNEFKDEKDEAISAKLAEVIKHSRELAAMISAQNNNPVDHVTVRWNHKPKDRIMALAPSSPLGATFGPCGRRCAENETCVCVHVGGTKFCECRPD